MEVKHSENRHGIPVLTYEELAGLTLGYDPWEIGLQTHQVSAEPLLVKMGVPFDPSKKYTGRQGENMGRPAKPNILKIDMDSLNVPESLLTI
jgi:heterodisulfide reductase subunit B